MFFRAYVRNFLIEHISTYVLHTEKFWKNNVLSFDSVAKFHTKIGSLSLPAYFRIFCNFMPSGIPYIDGIYY